MECESPATQQQAHLQAVAQQQHQQRVPALHNPITQDLLRSQGRSQGGGVWSDSSPTIIPAGNGALYSHAHLHGGGSNGHRVPTGVAAISNSSSSHNIQQVFSSHLQYGAPPVFDGEQRDLLSNGMTQQVFASSPPSAQGAPPGGGSLEARNSGSGSGQDRSGESPMVIVPQSPVTSH